MEATYGGSVMEAGSPYGGSAYPATTMVVVQQARYTPFFSTEGMFGLYSPIKGFIY